MRVCLYVCMYLGIYTYTVCMYVYICMYVYMYVCLYVWRSRLGWIPRLRTRRLKVDFGVERMGMEGLSA